MSAPYEIVALDRNGVHALQAFFDGLPERDLTFIKEDVLDPAVSEAWVTRPGAARRWVAVDEQGAVRGLLAVIPLSGWSSHVGELRLVVAPDARGRGIGAALARHALAQALDLGLQKVVVEVVAAQEGAVAMFTALGFRGEALLSSHIRDHAGELQDLLVLAHDAGEEWSSLESLGVGDDLAAGA